MGAVTMPMRRAHHLRLAIAISLIALFFVCSAASLKLLRRGVAWVGDTVWENDELYKRQQLRFQMTEDGRRLLPHWVISMPQAADRRAALQTSFMREDVSFELVDAFDGRDKLPMQHASKWVDERLLTSATLGKLPKARRAAIAAALSHLALMERAVAEQHSVVIQFEGDATLLPGFNRQIDYALRHLPSDWDVLYLSGCPFLDKLYSPFSPIGRYIGEGIKNLRWGITTCPTLAFMYRNSTAHKVLSHVQSNKLSLPFDVTLGNLAHSGLLNSYTTDHWLVISHSNVSYINK